MNDRLHEIIAECAIIHETNIDENIINDLPSIMEKLNDADNDIKEHYFRLLLQYYFQNNNVDGAQKLLLQGIKFDMRFEDIKEAFIHITSEDENVIEFFEDNAVMLKDAINDKDLKVIYDYYNDNESYQDYLNEALILIKKNRYVCAHVHKNMSAHSKFFLNTDLLDSLKRDMPFLLK